MSDQRPAERGDLLPYYEDDLVTLYCGDARKLTPWLAADVLVTDPPYGRAWRQSSIKHRSGRGKSSPHEGIQGDTDTTTRDAILALWGNRPGILFGDLMLTPPPGTRQVSVYVKPPDAGTRGAFAQVRRDLEAIYFTGTHGAGIGGRSGAFRTNASNVGGNAGLAAKAGGHPHTKPQDVMQELILLTSGVVADPFSGGGSTLVAAKQLGRRIIGIELEERYCEIAAKRLSQDSLFGDLVRVSSTGATS